MDSSSVEKMDDTFKAVHNEDSDELKVEAAQVLERDPKIEDRILRKCDYHILPWLFGIWLCAFIDRSNIGNARIDGLTEDLHLKGEMFNTALGKCSPLLL